MSPSDAVRRDGFRCARECALAVCAAWLLVQNVVLVAVVLAGGFARPLGSMLPVLGLALLLMAPLWLVPAGVLLLARARALRAAASGDGSCANGRAA